MAVLRRRGGCCREGSAPHVPASCASSLVGVPPARMVAEGASEARTDKASLPAGNRHCLVFPASGSMPRRIETLSHASQAVQRPQAAEPIAALPNSAPDAWLRTTKVEPARIQGPVSLDPRGPPVAKRVSRPFGPTVLTSTMPLAGLVSQVTRTFEPGDAVHGKVAGSKRMAPDAVATELGSAAGSVGWLQPAIRQMAKKSGTRGDMDSPTNGRIGQIGTAPCR